jgi:hypothetical protein
MTNLQSKINNSINLIKKPDSIALQLSPKDFYLAFSGGKVSLFFQIFLCRRIFATEN